MRGNRQKIDRRGIKMPHDETNIDFDNDGVVSDIEQKLYMRRRDTLRNMAVVALISMILTAIWILFIAEPERLVSIGTLLDLYWLSMGGIVASYMGSEAWTINSSR